MDRKKIKKTDKLS
jgi:hypothetical protein